MTATVLPLHPGVDVLAPHRTALRDASDARALLDDDPYAELDVLSERRLLAEKHAADERVVECMDVLLRGAR